MRKHRRIILAIHITPAGNLRPSYIDGRRRASRTLSDVTNKFSRRCLELRRLKTNTKRASTVQVCAGARIILLKVQDAIAAHH